MKVNMDNPGLRVVEFKIDPTRPMVAIKPPDYRNQCEHSNFAVSEKNRTVECGKCHRELDAMHVLILIAKSEGLRRWMKESAAEYERKENEKTQKAAVISLAKHGVTPEKFATLYEKYKVEAAPTLDTAPQDH